MSARTYAVDTMTRHQIYLQRLGTGQVNKMIPYVSKMLSDVKIQLSSADLTEFGRTRLSVLQNDLTQIINSATLDMGDKLTTNLIEFGEYEAEFTQKMLDDISTLKTGGVTIEQISASITDNKMSLISGGKASKLTIDQAISQLAKSTSRGVRHSITTGIAQGKTTKEISREISRVLKGRTAAQAEAVIRTAANHAGTQARNALYAENSDIITGEEFVATLDSRTSDTCAGNDGRIFPVGKGSMPPLHYNCRSIRIPVVDPEFVVGDLKGDRPSFGATGAKKVSGQSNFSGWLRKQPASFQDDYFRQFKDGAAKAKLFRNGGLPMERFINKKNISYSLAQLKKLEPKAFERAFPVKKVVKTATKTAATTKTVFIDKTTKSWNDAAFTDSPDWVKNKIAKYQNVEVLRNAKKGASATAGRRINMSALDPDLAKTQNTWRHEMGHIVDIRVGREQGVYYYSSSPEFIKAAKLDAERLKIGGGRGRSKKKIKLAAEAQSVAYTKIDETVPTLTGLKKAKYLEGLADNAGINFNDFEGFLRESSVILNNYKHIKDITDEVAIRIAKIIESYRLADANTFATQFTFMDKGAAAAKIGNSAYKVDGTIGSFTDLVGSATKNQVTSWNRGFSGHSDGYYKRSPHRPFTESFANLNAMSGHKNRFWWQIANQFTPNMAADFERIMKYEY